MKVLVACEFSGTVRDAFAARGHDAWSCDLLPTERPGNHIQGDVLNVLGDGWDLMIAHPPCTHLAVSGARWFKDKRAEQAEALEFVRRLLAAPVARRAVENPISIISSRIRKPDQIIQPWQFGHGETKATCLWLDGLPPLTPTNIVEGRTARVHRASPGPDRWKERSRTLPGIAAAMAEQWSHAMTHQLPLLPVQSTGFARADHPPTDPNVHAADVKRLTGQNAAILARLKEGPATNVELAAMSKKYTGRVSDLRAAGHAIKCTRTAREGVTVYTLEVV